MAQFDGNIDPSLSSQFGSSGGRVIVKGQSPQADDSPPQWQAAKGQEGNLVKVLEINWMEGARTAGNAVAGKKQFFGAIGVTPQDDWFERVIILPRRINAGIVLAIQSYTIDIFNSHRRDRRTLSSFVNNVGAGIVISGLPSLPTIVEELDGLVLSVDILPEGAPQFDGTLDFTFDTGLVMVQILGQRAILFAVEPEAPMTEVLEFVTDVLVKTSGKEQRRSLRANPRQVFDMTFATEGFDRQFLEHRIFGGHARPFGVPVWFEPAVLTSPILVGADTAVVDSTAFADYRVGSLAIVYESPEKFEALAIQSITATTLVFTTDFTKSFPAGARVMPVRTVRFDSSVRGEKNPNALQVTRVRATVVDSGVNLASSAAFPTFSSKVFLSEDNWIRQTETEGFERRLDVVDGVVGGLDAFSEEAVSRRGHRKGFLCRTRQRLWEVRQLLHFLRGRLTSFYIPTFYDDLTPTAGISSSGTTLNFRNAGLVDFVGVQVPRNAVRVTLTNGTTLDRTVNSASEIDPDTEQIVVSSQWGVNATLAEIARVTFVEKTRLDSDEVRLVHTSGRGDAEIEVPIVGVLE